MYEDAVRKTIENFLRLAAVLIAVAFGIFYFAGGRVLVGVVVIILFSMSVILSIIFVLWVIIGSSRLHSVMDRVPERWQAVVCLTILALSAMWFYVFSDGLPSYI